MKEIKIKNKELRSRYEEIRNENIKIIKEDHLLLIKNVVVLYKRYSNNEDIIVLALIYFLLFF